MRNKVLKNIQEEENVPSEESFDLSNLFSEPVSNELMSDSLISDHSETVNKEPQIGNAQHNDLVSDPLISDLDNTRSCGIPRDAFEINREKEHDNFVVTDLAELPPEVDTDDTFYYQVKEDDFERKEI